MAIWQECDRCGATTKDGSSRLWATATLSVAKSKPQSYDLCPGCFQDVRALLAHRGSLTEEQQRLLGQIWDNAQRFDQSIADISDR